MAHADDFFSPQDRCEICGAELEDEVVIQEFADGSLARLCPECAAGTALDDTFSSEPLPPLDEKPAKKRRGFRMRGAKAKSDSSADEASFPPYDESPSAGPEAENGLGQPVFDAQALFSESTPTPPPGVRPAAPEAPADRMASPQNAAQRVASDDLLDRTRELLLPVTDLIALQGEVQGALERLAASLESFAAELVTDTQGKSARVDERLRTLERELTVTRTRLSETEALLSQATSLQSQTEIEPAAPPEEEQAPSLEELIVESRAAVEAAEAFEAAAAAEAAAEAEAQSETPEAALPLEAAEPGPAGEEEPWFAEEHEAAELKWNPKDVWPAAAAEPEDDLTLAQGAESFEDLEATQAAEPPEDLGVTEAELAAQADRSAEAYLAAQAKPDALPGLDYQPARGANLEGEAAGPGQAAGRPEHEEPAETTATFRIDEVQAAQRYYNESAFVNRVRDVRRSIGRPKASITRLAGDPPRAIVTIFWDIVWYQYMVDLRRDLPSTEPRVVLHREGMDLDELAYEYKQKNSLVNDDGRLDASELEVGLLSDPSALITDIPLEESQPLEDATEEIWKQHGSPEFKWDD